MGQSRADAVRPWLELCRVSNLPTVWANALHGFAAAVFVLTAAHGDAPPAALGFYLNQSFMLLVSMSLLYAGGMMLNDVFDMAVDEAERPGRPIPSGRVSRRAAAVVGALCLLLGVAATLVYDSPAVPTLAALLAVCIVAYNALHHIAWAGLVLMPACRALVILTAGAVYADVIGTAVWTLHIALPAMVLASYTLAISLAARSEAEADQAWRKHLVMGLIAAMPLVDAALLAASGLWPPAAFCVGCAVLTALGQHLILGT